MITGNVCHKLEINNPVLDTGLMDTFSDSDEQLVSRIATGDEGAFEEILTRYRHKIYRIALRMTNCHSDAEDIVQEVSLTIYRKAHTFRQDARFSTWLYRLVTNRSISKIRETKRHRAESLEFHLPSFDDDGRHRERPVVDWSEDIEKKISEREIRKIIESAIEQLSPIDRSVVILSEVEELTNPEIGQITGLSVLAVKGRLHRARLFLRGKLAATLGYSTA